jgi:hypothetical protein
MGQFGMASLRIASLTAADVVLGAVVAVAVDDDDDFESNFLLGLKLKSAAVFLLPSAHLLACSSLSVSFRPVISSEQTGHLTGKYFDSVLTVDDDDELVVNLGGCELPDCEGEKNFDI